MVGCERENEVELQEEEGVVVARWTSGLREVVEGQRSLVSMLVVVYL